jgi:L-fuconolactonase
MTVDAHHHVWDLSVRDQPWTLQPGLEPLRRSFSFAQLETVARPMGVTATVVVQTVPDPGETPELLALAGEQPLVAGVVGWVDLTDAGVGDRLAELQAAPGGAALRGVRAPVQSEPDDRWLCRPDVRRGLTAVADAGLAFDLLVLPHQLPAAVETLTELPQLHFVLDHCAKPPVASGELEPWLSDIGRLAALPNVTCKLSGLVTEGRPGQRPTDGHLRPYVDAVLEAFGPARLMFGSDWPTLQAVTTYADWHATVARLTAALSSEEQLDLWERTARAAYGLDGAR